MDAQSQFNDIYRVRRAIQEVSDGRNEDLGSVGSAVRNNTNVGATSHLVLDGPVTVVSQNGLACSPGGQNVDIQQMAMPAGICCAGDNLVEGINVPVDDFERSFPSGVSSGINVANPSNEGFLGPRHASIHAEIIPAEQLGCGYGNVFGNVMNVTGVQPLGHAGVVIVHDVPEDVVRELFNGFRIPDAQRFEQLLNAQVYAMLDAHLEEIFFGSMDEIMDEPLEEEILELVVDMLDEAHAGGQL